MSVDERARKYITRKYITNRGYHLGSCNAEMRLVEASGDEHDFFFFFIIVTILLFSTSPSAHRPRSVDHELELLFIVTLPKAKAKACSFW